MESGAREYIDSSRAVDITQVDMKQSIQHKSKEAKKFAKVKHQYVNFEDTGCHSIYISLVSKMAIHDINTIFKISGEKIPGYR
jgi:hypothetical protein